MSKTPALSVMAIVVALALVSLVAAPVVAATPILTPKGTKVGIKFVDQVDTAKAATGAMVHFKVIEDVIVDQHVVIKKGTVLTGTINQVGHPFPQNAGFANIGHLAVTAVDKGMVPLNDVRVSAPLLGGDIRVKPGTYVTTTTSTDVTIKVPSGQH